MSVYRPKNKAGEFTSSYYHYDFQLGRRRFHGSTGCRVKRDAEREEQRQRLAAKEFLRNTADLPKEAPLTIDIAADRYWKQRGKFFKGHARDTFFSSITWLIAAIGAETPIRDITNSVVAGLVARRRGEHVVSQRKRAKNEAPMPLVSSTTVNRTVLEPLRMMMNYAAEAWDEPIGKVIWKKHRLAQPKERVRELSQDEERRLLEALPPDYRIVLRFALMTGCRLSEIVGLQWADIDWGTRQITIRGKGDKTALIPLTSGVRALLFPLPSLSAVGEPRSGPVFTYECRKKRGSRQAGDRLAITYQGLKTQWRRSRAVSGVTNFRFHDNRHSAATRILRAGGNLKAVQTLLRHEDITTTAKYAHVNDSDVRSAMEAAEAAHARLDAESPGAGPEVDDLSEKREAASSEK